MDFNFNNSKVIFLEMDDFKGNTLTINGKPFLGTVFVMVQGSFCGYCTKAKPDFTKLANEFGANNIGNGIVFATIKIDGESQEQQLGKALSKITGENLSGVPAYLIFKNGKFAGLHKGGRDYNSLRESLGI